MTNLEIFNQTNIVVPRPLDPMICDGVYVPESPGDEEYLSVFDRVVCFLDELEDDRSREFGSCLAYTTRMLPNTRQQFCAWLVNTVSVISEARQEDCDTQIDRDCLWLGSIGKKLLKVSTHEAMLVLDNGQNTEGHVWALKSWENSNN